MEEKDKNIIKNSLKIELYRIMDQLIDKCIETNSDGIRINLMNNSGVFEIPMAKTCKAVKTAPMIQFINEDLYDVILPLLYGYSSKKLDKNAVVYKYKCERCGKVCDCYLNQIKS